MVKLVESISVLYTHVLLFSIITDETDYELAPKKRKLHPAMDERE